PASTPYRLPLDAGRPPALALRAARARPAARVVRGSYACRRGTRGARLLDLMRRFLADLNPMLRGFLVIAAIALVVVLLKLQLTLFALFLIARIAFMLAIAFFVFLMWRERREEISEWGTRPRVVFYG